MRKPITYGMDLDDRDGRIIEIFRRRYRGLVSTPSDPKACWLWTGFTNRLGYGQFPVQINYRKRVFMAHRVMYFMHHPESGPVEVIRHTCDNPRCVNPAHLKPGTHEKNVADRVRRGRSARGEDHGRSKLTEEKVIGIKEDLLAGRSTVDLAREHRVDPKAIRLIRTGKNWAHVKVKP